MHYGMQYVTHYVTHHSELEEHHREGRHAADQHQPQADRDLGRSGPALSVAQENTDLVRGAWCVVRRV